MNKLLYKILLLAACTVAGGTIAMFMYTPDQDRYTKIGSIMLICGMLLTIISLIVRSKKNDI